MLHFKLAHQQPKSKLHLKCFLVTTSFKRLPDVLKHSNIIAMDVSFPTDPREFDSDDRISFSKLDQKFIAVHDDGNEYEFDADSKRWVLADEKPLEPPATGALDDFTESVLHDAVDGGAKKRKNGSSHGSEVGPSIAALSTLTRCVFTERLFKLTIE
jgi:hypothetical protein